MIVDTTAHPVAPETGRWPGLVVPRGARARVAGAVVDLLVRRLTRRLPLAVVYPDGTVVGASEDVPRLILHRPGDFAARVGAAGLIGFGESYMAGDWDAPDLVAVLTVLAAHVDDLVPRPLARLRRLHVAGHPAAERNSEDNTRRNIGRHYDLSNDFFGLFLDETMTYSAALFTGAADDLADAQRAKIDRLLDRAGVRAGTRLLEIGTGWGELAVRAAARGATVHTVTLSTEQQSAALARVAAAGLADRVRVELLDYRRVTGSYDAVVSVEMIEAVGYDYLDTYFATIDRVLAPGGRAAIQAITMPHDRMLATRHTYTWIQKYIFPGGFLPSVRALEESAARADLLVREEFSMGPQYARTLRMWRERFEAARTEVSALGFDETFVRMWRLYLAYSEAGFRSGYLDVGQFVLTRD
ncbi:cyclopropane-fatty-acyl-phospholipid synthase family protein [Nocardia asteroides]|uniref:cyclopropane-fatty-acyl-phospholipid synthase family protein n=1 Tax=Nocardia asteroides TaxID=1824 RepID=UPI003417D225